MKKIITNQNRLLATDCCCCFKSCYCEVSIIIAENGQLKIYLTSGVFKVTADLEFARFLGEIILRVIDRSPELFLDTMRPGRHACRIEILRLRPTGGFQ